MSNCISSTSFITLLKKSIPLYSQTFITKTSYPQQLHTSLSPYIYTTNKIHYTNLYFVSKTPLVPLGTFTTPPEFPSKRPTEVNPDTPVEVPQIPNDPNEFTVIPEPEINPPLPPPDPTPYPHGPDIPEPPIPSPPGPEIFPPPDEAPPPRQPPDVYPPNAPEILPPPSTPPPDIIPPTGPMIIV